MRIAIFTEVFLPKIDGVVTRLLRTLDQLAALGHEALVFAPGDPPGQYAGHRVVRVRSADFRPLYPELKVGLPTPGIARHMDAFRPDIVHAVNPVWLAAYGILAARRRALPLIASFHTDVPSYTQSLGIGALRGTAEVWVRYLHNSAELNLCTSEPMVARAREVGIRRVQLWPKGVDTEAYRPEKRDDAMRARLTGGHPEGPLIIYVGRLSREKDLEALARPMGRLPGARLALVGSGPHREELERVFAGTNTVMTGYLSGEELCRAFASADVFAFPSTTETLGLVALESLASAVPVVGANAGGIPDVVDDGVTGFLFPPGDEDALTDRLACLLGDPQRRAEMGAAGRAETLRHSWRGATESLVRAYETTIELHARGANRRTAVMRAMGRPAPWNRARQA